ncbi:hypothetical protein TEQG_08727 [Trichophyton equinum CBS 127.97]|uniref:Uncharacterized protein n=1 Tax=Trichophyton equinum (strain ATCC MYA-4606 / CBS 127.97) TaxID=559882 RepID=F2PX43_TRIEC|nr:hypothetical protein TEQG_08727 [Trichophyton equinum CBS 127.97]
MGSATTQRDWGAAAAVEAQAERDAIVPRSAQLLNRQHDKCHAYWPGRKRSAEAPPQSAHIPKTGIRVSPYRELVNREHWAHPRVRSTRHTAS